MRIGSNTYSEIEPAKNKLSQSLLVIARLRMFMQNFNFSKYI